MASITKRGKKWQVRIAYKDAAGNKKFKSKGGFNTKREAELYGNQLEIDVNNGNLINGKTDFPEYFWHWFKLYKEPSVGPRTYQTYSHFHKVLQRYFSNIFISDMTRKRYQEFINDFGNSHAKSTIFKMNSLIKACVQSAVYENDLKKDFTVGVKLVFDKTRTQKIEYLNINEMTDLVSYIITHPDYKYTSNYMILTAVYTGMRLGEIQALQWGAINWNFKTISVKQSWNSESGKFISTKNESSVRVIRVNNTLLNELKQLKEAHNPSDNQQVFANNTGNIPSSGAVNKALRNLMKKNDIQRTGFHFHSLRHTHVAYLLANHVDLYVIAKRLGHADVSTTSRIYSYLIDEYKTQADNQIESILDNIKGDNLSVREM
ncbi:site-specific integrase [Lentilactobacillus sp. SPB1-3]|uniref:Tyrosine-type recombinase/integrase n=1 Tax=Lentilactobacillus terminaliae TaxID=3003483 RepID=A0ACD5DCQ9_9LACO|nr:site-specific integrase [Lentilactobacillus sp. SPB1-3]MCZ0978158.1 site-specific integrase [Lentilactobacillus sp. SPB1-3]